MGTMEKLTRFSSLDSDSWLDSINDARSRIRRKLEDSPSLCPYPAQVLAKEYARARREVTRQTGLEIGLFPDLCPYGIEQVIEDWLPEINKVGTEEWRRKW
jgi:hypothetical protein